MTPEEYESKSDQLRLVTHRAGFLYARVRQFRAHGVASVIIDHEQQRLDALADQITALTREIIDHEMEHDGEPYLTPIIAGTLRADDAMRRMQAGIFKPPTPPASDISETDG